MTFELNSDSLDVADVPCPANTAARIVHAHSQSTDCKIQNWLRRLCTAANHKLCPIRLGLDGLAHDGFCPERFPQRPAGTKTTTRAAAKREHEFKLGRHCAESQLRQLGEDSAVEVNSDRSPAWPEGFVGSISHSSKWAWAAVARQNELRSIGVDTEVVAGAVTMQELQHEIATGNEWEIAAATGLTPRQCFSVIFSAKEAFYKCWYPVNPKYFDFKDAVVESASSECLRIRSTRSNPNFGTVPAVLDVHFLIHQNDVFTCTWMEQI